MAQSITAGAPARARLSPIATHPLMQIIGVVELICIWLLAIVINLLIYPGYFDIALRDFGLAPGALALGRLSQAFSS